MKALEELKNFPRDKRFTMLTAYDYPSARILEEAGIDTLLVGDSLGMVVQGKNSTREVTLDQMIYHTGMVARGASSTLIIADLPCGSYPNPKTAVESARKLMEAGADAVKFEGFIPGISRALTAAGIGVVGHLGLLPQTAENFRVQGKEKQQADQILHDARALEEEGVSGIVLECVPEMLAKNITGSLNVPTIGIGAGIHCTGQVLVFHDMLGYHTGKAPKFLKRFGNLEEWIHQAAVLYKEEVQNGIYPGDKETYH